MRDPPPETPSECLLPAGPTPSSALLSEPAGTHPHGLTPPQQPDSGTLPALCCDHFGLSGVAPGERPTAVAAMGEQLPRTHGPMPLPQTYRGGMAPGPVVK